MLLPGIPFLQILTWLSPFLQLCLLKCHLSGTFAHSFHSLTLLQNSLCPAPIPPQCLGPLLDGELNQARIFEVLSSLLNPQHLKQGLAPT